MVGIALYHCTRCDRPFVHAEALYQHLSSSQAHWPCTECGFDGPHRADLMSHYRKTGCRHVCEGCSGGAGFGWVNDSPEYWEHVAREHVCTVCGRHFGSESNLQHHAITHRNATIKCLACDRRFTTYGGMIIHLEAGTCASGIDMLDLNKSAAMCYQSRKWVFKEFRNGLREHIAPAPAECPFKCPTCEAGLPKLSSLFMHVASPSCGQGINGGAMKKLKRWLWKRHHAGYHRA
ncbi:hypothetical protein BU26DRAFT_477300 [Trematosphaeria pertusa]|uniref:C2H2-type domain-containing protein n=1 Tax=Trematosphaeria pertusa TaxID=390896 RepID=A0A6A6ITP2_9PLEO|nr:uncharacterized protein BU26DRAFT_477300 [Trematosphaeria pertusa]KAF2253242.1 hypothetical protein BU26DRAFT_477300 [Trematosphaeria pertusa]